MFLFVKASIVRFVQAVAPVTDETMRQDPAMVAAMPVIVGAGERREDRLEWLGSERGDRFGEAREVKTPNIPTTPLLHGCAASHLIKSQISRTSCGPIN